MFDSLFIVNKHQELDVCMKLNLASDIILLLLFSQKMGKKVCSAKFKVFVFISDIKRTCTRSKQKLTIILIWKIK